MTLIPQHIVLQSPANNDPLLDLNTQPSLDLQFATSKTLDDAVSGNNLITFSRASSATYVGSDGLIKTSLVNLLTYSEQFDQWTVANNSIITPNDIAAPDGTFTADRIYFATTSQTNISQNVTLTQGQNYTFSVYAKAITPGSNNNFIPYINSTTPRFPTDPFESTSEWQRFSFTFTHTNSTGSVPIFILNKDDEYVTNIYVWGAQLEEGPTATDYIPTTSTISGAPRFDHDPATGESLGLLLERESRTNLLTYSKQLDRNAWLKINSAITPNTTVSPDGTQNADTLTITTGKTFGRVDRRNLGLPLGVYTVSYYLKNTLDQGTHNLQFLDSANNVDTVTVASFANDTTPEWTRFTATVDCSASGLSGIETIRFNFRPQPSPSSGTSTVDMWGAQLEEGSSPTSYIPTSGSTVTRAADIAEITGTNFSSWYNRSEGTVFVEVEASGSAPIVGFNDGSASERWRVGYTNANNSAIVVVDGGVVQTNINTPPNTTPYNQFNKLAGAIAVNNLSIAFNGALISDSSLSVPVVNTLTLGASIGVSTILNGHIARLTYYPYRLANTTLEEITKS